MPSAPVFVASDIFRRSRHATGHPLAIPRVALTVDLCRALGWLPAGAYQEAPPASPAQLARFHHPDYIASVIAAERTQSVGERERDLYNLGVNGNAVYGEVFTRPATACGASILAARQIATGGIAYNPAGGTHHGLPARASGYCIFNDPVLAILELRTLGMDRVFYLDLDAHWGDGVQAAFAEDEHVFTLSIHEAGRWPMERGDGDDARPGGLGDRAGGAARNLPLPPPACDDEFIFLMETVVLPLIADFNADAIVVQAGCDALSDDPMARLALSNRALWAAVRMVMPLSPRLLVLGGGGYNPWAVARCWAGIWATLNGFPVPDRLPPRAEALLRSVRWQHRLGRMPPDAWFTTLADRPRCGPIRDEVWRIAAEARH